MNPKRTIPLSGLCVVLLLGACVVDRFRVGESRTISESVAAGSASQVRGDIEMAIGELDLSGGADDLLEAEFTFNVDDLEPQVEYSVSEDSGRLSVRHLDQDLIDGLPVGDYDDVSSKWRLRLADDIPLDLRMRLGAAIGDIDLRGMQLTELDVDVGAGEAELWLGGNPLRTAEVDLGAGKLTLDLSGDWNADLSVDIRTGVGQLIVYLPAEVGVIVDADIGIGALETSGLQRDGSDYVNDAYADAEVVLRIDIQGGVGDVTLEVKD
jgi:hypothetical protein